MFGVAILNLLPIPGLDGYAALEPHLPHGLRQALDTVRVAPTACGSSRLMVFGFFGFIWDAAKAITDALGLGVEMQERLHVLALGILHTGWPTRMVMESSNLRTQRHGL